MKISLGKLLAFAAQVIVATPVVAAAIRPVVDAASRRSKG